MVFVDNVRQEAGAGKSYTLGLDGSNLLKRITFDAGELTQQRFMLLTHLS